MGDRVQFAGAEYEVRSFPKHTEDELLVLTLGRVHDRSEAPGQQALAACPLALQVYNDPARVGTPVWDAERRPSGACAPYPSVKEVFLRERARIAREDPASSILGDSLPPGHYHLVSVLRLNGTVIRFHTGSLRLVRDVPLTRETEGLRLEPEARIHRPDLEQHEDGAGATVQVRVRVQNVSEQRIELTYGSCALHVELTPADTVGQAIWTVNQHRPICSDLAIQVVLLPGESFVPGEFSLEVPVSEILDNTSRALILPGEKPVQRSPLPEGRYRIQIALAVNRDTLSATAGEIELRRSYDP